MPAALRIAAFRRIWLAGLISDLGDWLLLVSLPVLVFQLTGSTFGTAVAFLVELAPPVLLAPVLGTIADRFDRHRTLLVVSVGQALLLVPLLTVHTRADLPVAYAVIAAESALAALFDPTKNALLPTLVPSADLISANAMIGLNQNLGRLVGGPVGGLLLAVGALPAIVLTDAVTFVLAAVLIASASRLAHVRAADRSSRLVSRTDGRDRRPAGTRSGPSAADAVPAPRLMPVLRDRRIRGGLVVVGVSSMAQGVFVVLFVVFVSRVLHGDAAETGLLRGVQAIGSIGAGLLLAALGRRLPAGRLSAVAATAFGLITVATWNAPVLTTAEPAYIALFIAVGAPGLLLMTGVTTTLQEHSPSTLRGRVFTALGVVMALGQAVGMLAAGVLGDRVGIVPVLNGEAGLYLVAGLIAWRWMARGPRHEVAGAARPEESTSVAPPVPAVSTGGRGSVSGRPDLVG